MPQPPPAMLLAIDTATTLTGLACYTADGVQAECVWQSGRNHTAHLMPQLAMLMQHLGRQPSDLHAVAVSLGPGSWSGLRVGLSLAKGLAIAGDLPLLGIGTLDALAHQFQQPGSTIVPIIRLGRDRFATARFVVGQHCQRETPDRNQTLADLCAAIHAPTLFCGDVDAATEQHLRDQCGDLARFPPRDTRLRRPAALAALGWLRYTAGERDTIAQLEPRYLGEPVRPPTPAPAPPDG